jgi:quercetin dioxygenase-like cupin family protein
MGVRPLPLPLIGSEKDRLHMATSSRIPAAAALALNDLIQPTEGGIASRVLAKTDGGNLTLFAFDAGQGLTTHTSPFDALVVVLEGAVTLTIADAPVRAVPGTIVLMPAGVPHALDASEASRLLLVMLKDRAGERPAP